MKAEELKTKTPDELQALLLDLKKEQFNLRFQRSQGQLANTARMREVRRTIARVKTIAGAAGDKTSPVKKEKAAKPAAKPTKKPAGKKAA